MNMSKLRSEWLGNVRGDILSGMVVALALIPEAIAFSIIAGVDPKFGLYASFCIAVVTSIVGGRPGMISAATGAMALVLVTLVKEHGLEYMLAATVLTGLIQIAAGALRLGQWIDYVSKSVVTGFVNALAILIFMAQLPEFSGANWQVYVMVAAGLGMIYGLPYVIKSIPSPLITIVVLTGVSMGLGLDIRTVGDMGALPDTFPMFLLPNIPLNVETLLIILPYSITLAAVGLMESLMTSVIVDDMTDTPSQKNRECAGQGLANIVTGFFGGMAGCAMIGQSVINVKSGGRGRLSSFVAGTFLLFLILVLGDFVRQIPMVALVAVMIMVSISTFNWRSIKTLRTHPRMSSLVMITTVAIVVVTHNLALGVFIGVLISALSFASKVARYFDVTTHISADGLERTYVVHGQVFFASAPNFAAQFDYKETLPRVLIDLTHAHFWDITGVAALDKVVIKLRRAGCDVQIVGMNEASATIIDTNGTHRKPDQIDALFEH